MSQFSMSFLGVVIYLLFFYGFFSLGLWPLMLFIAVSCTLVLVQWFTMVNSISIGRLFIGALMLGASASILFFVKTTFIQNSYVAVYPVICVWGHDFVGRLINLIVRDCRIPLGVMDYGSTWSRFISGVLALLVINWYYYSYLDPFKVMRFPTTYFGILGLSALSSVCMIIGRSIVSGCAGTGHVHEDGCQFPGNLNFVCQFGSFLVFAYLIGAMSFASEFVARLVLI